MTACVSTSLETLLSYSVSACFLSLHAMWHLHTCCERRALKNKNAGNSSVVLWLRFIGINCINSYLWCCANWTCAGGGCLRSPAGSRSVALYSSYESLSRKTHLLSLGWISQSLRQPLRGLRGGSPWQHRGQKIELKSQSVCEMFWFVHEALSLFIQLPNSPCSQHTHSSCTVPKPALAANSFQHYCSHQKSFWLPSSFCIVWPIEDVAAVPFPIMPLDASANQNEISPESFYNAVPLHWQ